MGSLEAMKMGSRDRYYQDDIEGPAKNCFPKESKEECLSEARFPPVFFN